MLSIAVVDAASKPGGWTGLVGAGGSWTGLVGPVCDLQTDSGGGVVASRGSGMARSREALITAAVVKVSRDES